MSSAEELEPEELASTTLSESSSSVSLDSEPVPNGAASICERYSSEELDRLSLCLSEATAVLMRPGLLPSRSSTNDLSVSASEVSTASMSDDELSTSSRLNAVASSLKTSLKSSALRLDELDTQQLLEAAGKRLSTNDDLDLNLASSEYNEPQSSVIYDVLQAQVALWTCLGTALYSFAWRQHRKKFILSIFFTLPPILTICCFISGLLTIIILLGRLFSSERRFINIIGLSKLREAFMPAECSAPTPRKRTLSGTSTISWHSEEFLPRPLCRRHSQSNNTISSRPASSRKLSYCYNHNSSDPLPVHPPPPAPLSAEQAQIRLLEQQLH